MPLATGSHRSSVQSGPDGGAAGTHVSVTGPHIYFWDINHVAAHKPVSYVSQVHHDRMRHRGMRTAILSEFPWGEV